MTIINILAIYCLLIQTVVFFNTIEKNLKFKNALINNLWITIIYFLPIFIIIVYCFKY